MKKTFLLFFLCIFLASCANQVSSKKTMGWIEYARLEGEVLVKAKLDTGAKTSSIHGTHLKIFKRNGEKWLRFTFEERDGETKKMFKKVYEKKIVRHVRIKDHKSKSRRRPVVEMNFELAGKTYSTQFSVTDRDKFIYPILLGRRFLKDVAVIDPSQIFIHLRFKKE